MSSRFAAWFIVVVCSIAGCTRGAQTARDVVDTARIVAADREPGNWLTYGRTYDEQRYSPLMSITAANVARLGLAWSYDLGVNRGAEATPIVVDGVMYVTSAWSIVHAIDAATGRRIWVYDPNVSRATGAKACCDAINRGVAVYGDKVFVGALDGRLIAIDAKTGARAWDTVTVDQAQPYTITGAPRAVNGLVYIGNGGAEFGVRGYVSAYDAETGALRWRFYTVPGDPAKGPDGAASDSAMPRAATTWNGTWWKGGGGGTVWDAIVYDADFDQLLIGVGNGSPWNREVRSPGGGDNLFLSSIVALDAQSGTYRWHYQTTPGETWDYTATQSIVLADLAIGGGTRKVALQAPKNGFFYVIDRTNGRLVSARPYLRMLPAKDTPPGAPLAWAHAIDAATGRPIENPGARYEHGLALIHPGPDGGHNWQPMSFSPQTGLVYVPTQDMAIPLAPHPGYTRLAGISNLGARIGVPPSDTQARRIRVGATGALLAWDPVQQREVWRATRRGPHNGGTLATAGGLVFQGTVDGQFLALDARSGAQLWSFDNQAATMAGPVSYEANGDQYVAVAAGYGSSFFLTSGFLAPRKGASINARVYGFRIDGRATKPSITFVRVATPRPPTLPVTLEGYRNGAELYGRFCLFCHGVAAVSGGVLPDLRKSGRLQDAALWNDAVVGEALASRGMPRFSRYLTPEQAELLRAYVARQAAMLYEEEQAGGSAGRAASTR